MITFSIIIVNYNTRQLLLGCLHSVMETPQEILEDIWVVDNASNNGNAEAVSRTFPDIHLLVNKTNLGFARVNNQLLALAVINLLDNPQQSSLLREAAAERVKVEFSVDRTIAQIQAIYQELLAG